MGASASCTARVGIQLPASAWPGSTLRSECVLPLRLRPYCLDGAPSASDLAPAANGVDALNSGSADAAVPMSELTTPPVAVDAVAVRCGVVGGRPRAGGGNCTSARTSVSSVRRNSLLASSLRLMLVNTLLPLFLCLAVVAVLGGVGVRLVPPGVEGLDGRGGGAG